MTTQDLKQRISTALDKLKSDEVTLDNDYRHKWQSGMAIFDILQSLERIRNKRAELETALKIIEEYE